MDGLTLVISLAVSVGVAALSTPLASRLAHALDVVDRPNERKVSRREQMPLLGGVAVVMGCFAGLAAALLLSAPSTLSLSQLVGLTLGGLLLLGIGALDDRYGLSALPKLPVQILAAAIAIQAGFAIEQFRDPFSDVTYQLPLWLSWAVTGLWIVGVTNALNFMDGLDGLTAGIGAIVGVTLTMICWQAGQWTGVVVGTVLVGALLGFLPFNFPPARIFLGDAGALVIGYILSLIALDAYLAGFRRAALLTFVVPILALAVPILDTTISVVRRIRAGKPPWNADRQHIHHRLLQTEGSQRPAVLSLYFLAACFCVIALSFTRLQGAAALIFLGAVVALTIRLVWNLGILSDLPDDTEAAPSGAEGESR